MDGSDIRFVLPREFEGWVVDQALDGTAGILMSAGLDGRREVPESGWRWWSRSGGGCRSRAAHQPFAGWKAENFHSIIRRKFGPRG